MKLPCSLIGFLLLLTLAAVFVFVSADSLPPMVASHFVAGGTANGFLPRSDYLALMIGVTVGLPFLMVSLSFIVRLVPPRLINLPNREYWLAPERSAETLAYLERQGSCFGVLLAGFLCFVHWLVVNANRQHPPQFPESQFFTGSLLFFVALVVWLGVFFVHFRRRP